MITAAIGFVFGAWLLQQQANLPSQFCWLVPVLLLAVFYFAHSKLSANLSNFNNRLFKFFWILFTAFSIGFCWAATFAHIRLSDELPKNWQQKSIDIIGVIATLPEQTERGVRFQFDVEQVLTQDADLTIPQHIALTFYPKISVKSESSSNFKPDFHAGQRWQFSVKLKRPHGTYNPHGFDFEAWALSENIRATGTISNKSGYRKLQNFVLKPAYLVEYCREKIGIRISQALLDRPYAGVIRALVIGDDSQINADDWTVYLRTGTNHLMSISYLLKH